MRAAALSLLVLAGCARSAEPFRLDGSSVDDCVGSFEPLTAAGDPDSARADRAVRKIFNAAAERTYERGGAASDAEVEVGVVCRELDGATLDEILITLD